MLETQGLLIEYDMASEIWQFSHNGADFVAWGTTFVVPAQERLCSIQGEIEKLLPEMGRRLAKGWKDSNATGINVEASYIINLTDLHSHGTYDVQWSGDESWGDVVVDFTINDHDIADESWGD